MGGPATAGARPADLIAANDPATAREISFACGTGVPFSGQMLHLVQHDTPCSIPDADRAPGARTSNVAEPWGLGCVIPLLCA